MDYKTLAPYNTHGQCNRYTSCTGCISDASCGWCNKTCTERTLNSTCVDTHGHPVYMYHKQEQCTMCSDYFTCNDCFEVSEDFGSSCRSFLFSLFSLFKY